MWGEAGEIGEMGAMGEAGEIGEMGADFRGIMHVVRYFEVRGNRTGLARLLAGCGEFLRKVVPVMLIL